MHKLVAYVEGVSLFTNRAEKHTYMGDSFNAIHYLCSQFEPETLDLHINGVQVNHVVLDKMVQIMGY